MKYKDVILNCNEAVYNVKANTAHIKGNVRIKTPKGVVIATRADYDFNNKTARIKNIRLNSYPLYGEAAQGAKVSSNEYILKNGYVTTCNREHPHYTLNSRRIIVYPGKRIIAKNVVLKIGKIPIFYIPYLSRSLKDMSSPVTVIPGKDKDWGYYLLTRWRYYLGRDNRGRLLFDWYNQRGEGVGVRDKLHTKKYGDALFNLYYIRDKLYENNPDVSISADRYKTQLSYNNHIGNLNLTGEFNKFSDINFMKDFFYREYELDTHPMSYFLADYSFSNSSLSLLTQVRANNFFEETEYLPQLTYNFYRQRIRNTHLYFESTASFGNLSKKFADSSTEYSSMRLNDHSILSYIRRIAWLSIAPYVGIYSTFYSKAKFGNNNVWRQAPESGITFSTRIYKIIHKGFNFMGERIDKLRHILTPAITYSYIHPPTTSKNELFSFDAIDDLARQENIVFSLGNKLQAKNKQRTWDLLYFNPSLEYTLNQEGKGSFLDNLTTKLEFYPRPGMSFTMNSKYSFVSDKISEFNADFGISDTRNHRWSAYLGHRYAQGESNQGTLSFTYQLTPKWQLKEYLRYEYNTGTFQEQQYALRRDLHCWWMDIGVDVDNNHNYTLWVIFRIKAFPGIRVGFDHTYNGTRASY